MNIFCICFERLHNAVNMFLYGILLNLLLMKRVLGLDLGSSSIGWAVVEENSVEVTQQETDSCNSDRIVAIGSRIIPLSTDESSQFSAGQALTKNADRTQRRTQRKGYDRYQLRRALLLEELARLGMYAGETLKLHKLELWKLRAMATTEQLSLLELGRVLCHLNQKRGYKTAKTDYSDKKQGAYVQQVVGNYSEIHKLGVTVGQYMYDNLKANPAFRCKERVYPRDAYVEEFDAIMACQRKYYPTLLTDSVVDRIRDYIIFHQRPLKSCKHLVARCELERHDVVVAGRVCNCGPKVAPRSSPLFQVCKIWECINNLCIRNKHNEVLHITLEQKRAIFDFMNTHEKLKVADLKSILAVKGKEWLFGKAVGTGLQGNTTYCRIKEALGNYVDAAKHLEFNLNVADGAIVNIETGELTKVIDASFEEQPLYKLWHALYSLSNIDELRKVLTDKFSIKNDDAVDALCKIDFVKSGYSNKSSRAIRKVLPYLQEGMLYYDAKIAAGYNDTALTKEQNAVR